MTDMTNMPNVTSQIPNPKKADNQANVDLNIAIIGGGLTGLMTADLLEQALKSKHQKKEQSLSSIARKIVNHTKSQSFHITIFEKSAGVGRTATRYKSLETNLAGPVIHSAIAGTDSKTHKKFWQFDFGAQFFTAKSEDFQTYLMPWIDKGVIEPWQAQTARINSHELNDLLAIELSDKWDSLMYPRFISSPKMTSWGRAIAKKLTHTTIQFKTRVAPFASQSQQSAKTGLRDEAGNDLGSFDWVVCTAPQAQAIELLSDTNFTHFEAISTHNMLACYTLMLGWTSVDKLPEVLKHAQWDVLYVDAKQSQQSVIDRVFIEHNKPSRKDILPSITVHASNEWAQAHVDDDINEVKSNMIKSVGALLGFDVSANHDLTKNVSSQPTHIDCHRWRYAATANKQLLSKNLNDKPMAYLDKQNQWIVTGDWCGEGRIESCFDAAQTVIALMT